MLINQIDDPGWLYGVSKKEISDKPDSVFSGISAGVQGAV